MVLADFFLNSLEETRCHYSLDAMTYQFLSCRERRAVQERIMGGRRGGGSKERKKKRKGGEERRREDFYEI